jgi:uncharacterized protein YndB with AHSA1/START domain
MQTMQPTTIKKELTVQASQQTAFKVFTEQMDLWWPRTHHTGSTPMTEMVVEAKPNGRWYTKHEDGSENSAGHVIKYEPYDLFVLNWQLGGDFKFHSELVSEVVVQFIAEGPKTTRVRFEHRNLDRIGDGKTIDSMDQGWSYIMDLYKKVAEK